MDNTNVVEVNPFRCRMWDYHDRLESSISEESCREEAESFLRHGQLIPVLGRPLQNNPDYDVELVYGARRLFVARMLNKPLQVELRSLTDKEAIVAMDAENRLRQSLSPYERGMAYARWIRTGLFESQEEIAEALGISSSQVSRVLRLARLPAAVVAAFGDASEICEGWGHGLAELLDSESCREAAIATARRLATESQRPPAREVYRRLMMCAVSGRKVRPKSHDYVVKTRTGRPVFRIRHLRTDVALLLPTGVVSAQQLKEICDAVLGILETSEPRQVGTRQISGINDGRRARSVGGLA